MARWLILIALFVALAGAVVWQYAAKVGEPNPHRREMYQRTLEATRASCEPRKAGLESYCHDQAGLLLEFPECDSECVAFARRIRGEPAR